MTDFDEDLIDTYTSSECWALAWQLHQITGWPPVAIADRAGWYHVACQRPDGNLVDIHGANSPIDVLDMWQDHYHDPRSATVANLPTDPDGYADATHPFRHAVDPERDRRIAAILATTCG